MTHKNDVRRALHDADESLTTHYRDVSARVLAAAVHELTEALEDAITGCSNPRQEPSAVLVKYKEALNE